MRCGSRIDIVLLDEAADAGDLGDAFRLRQRELQAPVLDGARVGEVQFLRHHRVLVDPADAGGVRSDRRCHAGRQSRGGTVEEFEHARTRPVDVGPVFEDDVDERHPEEGKAAHHLRTRHGQHRRRQRIGDLILDHLRRLAGIFRVDDHLRVREIGDRVERQMNEGVDAGGSRKARAEQHQQQVAGRPTNQPRDHGLSPASEKPFERRLQVALGIDQEVRRNHDRVRPPKCPRGFRHSRRRDGQASPRAARSGPVPCRSGPTCRLPVSRMALSGTASTG